MESVRNIIFDMDGTLVDTAKATVAICTECARDLGLPPREPDTIKHLIGWPDPEFYYRMYPELARDVVDRFGREVEQREARYIEQLGQAILFPGIRELLDRLLQMGCFLAVASTGSPEHVRISLTAGSIQDAFTAIRCGEAVKVRMVSEIMEQGIPGNWIMVGDKEKDAAAAQANGITSVAARYGYGTEEEYGLFDAHVDTPLQLLDLLNNESQ